MRSPASIVDPDDPRVAVYRDLRGRDCAVRPHGFIAEGAMVLDRAVASGGLSSLGLRRNSEFRDELLKVEVFYRLHEAEVLTESWRRPFDTAGPHSSKTSGVSPT